VSRRVSDRDSQAATIPVTPYWATKQDLYAHSLFRVPNELMIKVMMIPPTVNAMAERASKMPRRANGAICQDVTMRSDQRKIPIIIIWKQKRCVD
jgi:hypothetical protein